MKNIILKEHFSNITSICSNSKRIVSSSIDNMIIIWDSFGKVLLKLEGHSDSVNSVAYSIDEKNIVSGSSDKTLIIWDALTGKIISKLNGHIGIIKSVAYSPDSKKIISGSTDNKEYGM